MVTIQYTNKQHHFDSGSLGVSNKENKIMENGKVGMMGNKKVKMEEDV